MAARDHPLLGKWRSVATALGGSDLPDLVEPAYIRFDAQGRGEFVFGAVQGSLHCRYGPAGVRFTWQGSDEMDPVSGAGDAELDEDGLLTGEIRFHDGDDSTFKARRWWRGGGPPCRRASVHLARPASAATWGGVRTAVTEAAGRDRSEERR